MKHTNIDIKTYLRSKLTYLNIQVHNKDEIMQRIQSKEIIKAKRKPSISYLYNISYFSHPVFIAGRMEYYFETDGEEQLICDFKEKTTNYIGSCTCSKFNDYYRIQIPCQHIYKIYFNFNSTPKHLINVYNKIKYFKNNIKTKIKLTNQKRINKLLKQLTVINNEINYYNFVSRISFDINIHQYCKHKINSLINNLIQTKQTINHLSDH